VSYSRDFSIFIAFHINAIIVKNGILRPAIHCGSNTSVGILQVLVSIRLYSIRPLPYAQNEPGFLVVIRLPSTEAVLLTGGQVLSTVDVRLRARGQPQHCAPSLSFQSG
jgi:hypothetical protein